MVRLTLMLMIALLPLQAICAGSEPPQERTETQTASSQKLGRLFYSPDERAMLDRLRKNDGRSTASPTERITLNGIVRRSSGKTTAWINQLPQHENQTPQGIGILPGSTSKPSAVLLLPAGKQVNLKAGQTFDTAKGKVHEGFEEPSVQPQKTTE